MNIRQLTSWLFLEVMENLLFVSQLVFFLVPTLYVKFRSFSSGGLESFFSLVDVKTHHNKFKRIRQFNLLLGYILIQKPLSILVAVDPNCSMLFIQGTWMSIGEQEYE